MTTFTRSVSNEDKSVETASYDRTDRTDGIDQKIDFKNKTGRKQIAIRDLINIVWPGVVAYHLHTASYGRRFPYLIEKLNRKQFAHISNTLETMSLSANSHRTVRSIYTDYQMHSSS